MKRRSTPLARARWRVAVLAVAAALAACTRGKPAPSAGGSGNPAAAVDGCHGPAVVTAPDTPNAHRRLALIVAVGRFKNPDVPPLDGPPADAKRMYDLLTDARGYAFPMQNVCVLVNEQATLEGFDRAFREALIARVEKGKNDAVVVYYSGHGSTTVDLSGDEVNGFDQTWVLHDSRSDGRHDLLDDHVFELLKELGEKTGNISVVLDSCNSGSAVKAGSLVARAVPAERLASEEARPAPPPGAPRGDGTNADLAQQIPGLVLLAATRDGTYAYEASGRGIFTDALVRVLGGRGGAPLTYDQIQGQVRSLVAAESPQVPGFEGELDRVVFGNQARPMPLGYRVASVGQKIVLRGPPVPGIGPGAELRVYGEDQTPAAVADPARSIATLVVESPAGELAPVARVTRTGPASGALQKDDLVVLARPSPEYTRLRVRLRAASAPGGVPHDRAARICRTVASDGEAGATVRLLVDGAAAAACAAAAKEADASDAVGPGSERAALEVTLASDGVLELRDANDLLRRRYVKGDAEARDVTANLWAFARQASLVAMVPEGGGKLVENRTIAVRIVRNAAKEPFACEQGSFREPSGAEPYHLPVCFRYAVEAEVSKDSPVALRVGGLVLSFDGSIIPLVDQLDVLVQPGRKKVLGGAIATPPDGARDSILVIGTQAQSPIRVEQLAARGGVKSAADDEATLSPTAWTRSIATFEVYANPEFATSTAAAPVAAGSKAAARTKEWTVDGYDIRPFLPRDRGASLHRMLVTADRLVRTASDDGVPYKQHPWKKGSDAANLKEGIDCSRTVHYAFTRAGLPYNDGNDDTPGRPATAGKGRYLTTEEMARADGPMKDYFDRCDDDPALRTGDVLVYRDAVKKDGHTVIVVDPERRVAVGSHGWDGNEKEGKVPDTGAEYQLIKNKKDWDRWDRRTMLKRACWRYRRFTEEARQLDGRAGSMPLEITCRQGCVRAAPP